MAESSPSALEQIARILVSHGVKFIVIGGQALAKHAVAPPVGDMQLKIIGLDDLIRIKQHIGRAKDQSSLMQLLAIKRVREEEGLL
jgi:predicted nucleotidyltransferase